EPASGAARGLRVGGVIYLLDARSGALLRKVPNPEPGLFLNPVIARVGRRLVISNIDGGVRRQVVEERTLLASFGTHDRMVPGCSASATGVGDGRSYPR